ncbi:MAG: DUF3343 domain-containing protein [Syntrophobacteraceae bacterium]|jgi:hypothetical protein|nr:DUF3343 domain-containing protein [Syntrophobacteraceae bacterium]
MFWHKVVQVARSLPGILARQDPGERGELSDRAIVVFHHTSEVIRGEALLRKAGIPVAVKGPPPELRTGCDLVIEVPLAAQLEIARLLAEASLEPLRILPLQDPLLEPVSLYHVKDFGDHLMVRAANMKITVDKGSLRIVNVSGGGCPDVPYLAEALVGRTLAEAPPPRTLGHTLCGYALQLAYEELVRRCRG